MTAMTDHHRLCAITMIERLVSESLDNPEGRINWELCKGVRAAMLDKLESSAAKGRGGWYNPDGCDLDSLRSMLDDHVSKGDMIDVINLAAMIWIREEMDQDIDEGK